MKKTLNVPQGGPQLRRFHRLPKVEEITGYRRTQLYEKIARGEFPAPVPLSDFRQSGRLG